MPTLDAPISWTWAWAITDEHWRLVPAQDIWFRIPELSREPRLVACTTSGCSLGATVEEAAVFAAFELIERDAFLTAWYLKRRAILIEPRSARSELTRLLVERFYWAFPHYRLVMVDLTSDVGIPTVGGFAFRTHGEGPCVYAAAATHVAPEQAFSKALKDLMGFRPESPKRLEARGPTAHFQHFAAEAALSEFSYLQLESAELIEVDAIGAEARGRHRLLPTPEMHLDNVLRGVANALHAAGSQLYIADITHPFLRDRPLAAVRAITPGLYPLWFGRRAKRFSITDRLRRLAVTYKGSCLDPQSLRLTPHPLS
jgi:ribosomal protein S12 methylthiotransferase accessory factor